MAMTLDELEALLVNCVEVAESEYGYQNDQNLPHAIQVIPKLVALAKAVQAAADYQRSLHMRGHVGGEELPAAVEEAYDELMAMVGRPDSSGPSDDIALSG